MPPSTALGFEQRAAKPPGEDIDSWRRSVVNMEARGAGVDPRVPRRFTAPLMKLLTRDVPNGIICVSDHLGLSTVPHPEVPNGVAEMSPKELDTILIHYTRTADAADRRANGSVPAAGLLSIASSVISSHAAAVAVIVVSAVTILMALFAVNAQVEPYPHEQPTVELVKQVNDELRRKVAWAELSSYFAFGVAVAVGILAIVTS